MLIPHLGEAAVAGVDSQTDYALPCIVKGVVWGIQHIVVDGIGILLVQPGIGRRALRRVLVWAVPWGVFTAVVTSLACFVRLGSDESRGGETERWILAGYYALHALAYFVIFTQCLWWAPCRQKRPAFRIYALGWIVLRGMAICEDLISYVDEDAAICLNFCTVRASFIVAVPLLIYTVFKEDTAFWYGMAYTYSAEELNGSKNSGFLRHSRRKSAYSYNVNQGGNDIRRPLIGLQLPNSAIETMRKGIETLDRKSIISSPSCLLMWPPWCLCCSVTGIKVFKGTWRQVCP